MTKLKNLFYKFKNYIKIINKIFLLKIGEIIPIKTLPYSLAISVTNRCNLKCKTCGIWNVKNKGELSTEELRNVLKSIGRNIPWFTITGGEPFLRKDLFNIIKNICDYNSPVVINIATNGSVSSMHNTLEKIMGSCNKNINFVINFSIDEIGKKYNEIRGINIYKEVISNYKKVKKIKKKYPNLFLGVNIALSKFNVNRLTYIYDFISKNLNPDSIIVEPATIRKAFYNEGMKFQARKEDILVIIDYLIKKEKEKLNKLNGFAKIIRIFRYEYYSIVLKTLKYKKKLIDCYASTSFAEILTSGDIINCGLKKEILVNVRDYNFNFKKAWYSKEAGISRIKIKNEKCFCTMANPIYSSMILNNRICLSFIKDFFK